jgi:hypothetical protein
MEGKVNCSLFNKRPEFNVPAGNDVLLQCLSDPVNTLLLNSFYGNHKFNIKPSLHNRFCQSVQDYRNPTSVTKIRKLKKLDAIETV